MSAAFQRHQVFTFPTPSRTDLLFYEIQDRVLPKNNPNNATGEYGEAHWDSVKYPNHKLVFRSPHDPNKGSEKWWYAADRANQDDYNWNFTQANLGSVKFDAVERYYFYKRADFTKPNDTFASGTSSIEQGDPMPNTPAGKFDYAEFILSDRETIEAPEELRSLYIIEKRVYFRRKSIATVQHEEMLGIGQGSVITLHYRGESVGGTAIEDLINAPSNAYWGVQSDGTVRTGEQLTHRWFAVITLSSLDDALEAYRLSFPTTVDMLLPDELLGVSTVWNQAGSNGSFAVEANGYSAYVGDPSVAVGLSESANAECGGSLQPEIVPSIRSRNGRDVPATAWFFYIKSDGTSVSVSDLIARLAAVGAGSVSQWPVFHPTEHTFILKGQRAAGRAQVSASGSVRASVNGGEEQNNKEVSSGKGNSYDHSTSFGTVRLPPTIHGAITVSDTTPPSATYTATCSAGWTSYHAPTGLTVAGHNIALPVPANDGSAGSIDPSNGTAGSVSTTATISLSASVTPTSLSATGGETSIPTSGKYIVGSPRIEPYKARWFRVHAIVIDASVFAP